MTLVTPTYIVFNVCSCTAELNVCSVCGGVWKFPVKLSATMATPDDVIVIEAAGLNRESQIRFRLTSLQEYVIGVTTATS